ncbi:MAG: LPO_1073/Vpar_1526 family protein [Vulcanimicrobiaceae bacterium]
MSSGQRQDSGDHSINLQAHQISVGLDYGDVRSVAMDVFEANFMRLSEVAANTARQRAEDLLEAFLKRVQTADGKDELAEAQNPDFQYALFSAQREFAKSGDADLGDLLVGLLVDRAREPERSLLQIVLNESLSVAPKLTADQLDALSLAFMLRYTRTMVKELNDLSRYISNEVVPFVPGASRKQSAYQHLEFASCANLNAGFATQAEGLLRRIYPGLFQKGFSYDRLRAGGIDPAVVASVLSPLPSDSHLWTIAAVANEDLAEVALALRMSDQDRAAFRSVFDSSLMTDQEVKDKLLVECPISRELFDLWSSTPLRGMSLTSVGIAIAHANIQRKTGQSYPLAEWL